MRFQWISQELVTYQSSAHRFAQSFNHSLVSGVKIGHRNKFESSELNLVESSRSKSTTCQRKGSLLRFWSNSTATPDGCVQKFGNNVWHDCNRSLQPNQLQPSLTFTKIFPSFQVLSSHFSEVALSKKCVKRKSEKLFEVYFNSDLCLLLWCVSINCLWSRILVWPWYSVEHSENDNLASKRYDKSCSVF